MHLRMLASAGTVQWILLPLRMRSNRQPLIWRICSQILLPRNPLQRRILPALQKEEKEKLRVSNNLTELDAKSAKELVAEGKKGITADFNGVISKSAVQQGAAATQGMELFTLQNTDKVSVDINVSKYDYA